MRLIGILLAAIGILLLMWGADASDSIRSKISEFFSGTPSDRAIGFTVAGTAMTIVGLAVALAGGRRRKTA